MPDNSICPPEHRCSALADFTALGWIPCPLHGEYKHAILASPKAHDSTSIIPTSHAHGGRTTRGRSGAKRKSKVLSDEPRNKAQRKCSSKYYGVRLKRDLQKYVAELRVSEWKDVDKKVWLGTYKNEVGAARAVDLARKLLKCKKDKPFNLPCVELDNRAMSLQIPPNLILSDLTDQTMFMKVKAFIKKNCKKYAASFESPELNSWDSTVSAAQALYSPVGIFSHEEVDMHSDSELSTPHTDSDSILPSDQLHRTQFHSSNGGFQASGSNVEFSFDNCLDANTPLYNYGLQQEQQKQMHLGIESNGVITSPALMTTPSLIECPGGGESQELVDADLMELIQQINSPCPFTSPIPDPSLCFMAYQDAGDIGRCFCFDPFF